MKRLGFGGILMTEVRGYWEDDDHVVNPKAEIGWGSTEWYDRVEFTIRECARLGHEFSMNASCEGRRVEMWDTVTGGSCFVVFAPGGVGEDGRVERVERVEICITNAWQVSFAYMDGISAAPPAPVTMETLRDWTTYGKDGEADSTSLRYFSGTAAYKTTVAFAAGSFGVSELGFRQSSKAPEPHEAEATSSTLRLSLGELPSGLAHVFVNGVDCGVVWCAPWEASIPPGALRDGENEVEIRYTNNWYNRLVGDCFLKPGDRITRSTLRYCKKPRGKTDPKRPWLELPTVNSGPAVSDSLQPSGMLGPVRIRQQGCAMAQ